MKLYLLHHIKSKGYDVNRALVVRAESVLDARRLAAEKCGDEGSEVWTDKSETTCAELTQEGERCVILVNFVNG